MLCLLNLVCLEHLDFVDLKLQGIMKEEHTCAKSFPNIFVISNLCLT